MNLTKTSIVAVVLLSFLTVGCRSTKVVQTTAQTDSLAIAAKKQERMDSIIREVRIRDAKREREQELDEARKKNPQNLIDSIKLGLADGIQFIEQESTDSAWVYYREAERIPDVLKEVFPQVFFFKECIVQSLPMSCFTGVVFNNRMWGYTEFNQLSEVVANTGLDDLKRIEAYVIWRNIDHNPHVKIRSITKSDQLSSDESRKFNYVVELSGALLKYNYVKYENGVILDCGVSLNGEIIN